MDRASESEHVLRAGANASEVIAMPPDNQNRSPQRGD